MLFKSALITSASGSVGGMTASHNKGGQYFRARSIPTDPGTSLQVAVRNQMAILASAWVSVLTQAQRDAWQTYAENVLIPNPMGDARQVPALAMYTRSNVSRLQASLPRVDDAPTTFDLGSFTDPSFAFDASADEIDVTFDNSDTWANEDDSAMLVYTSAPQNPTIQFFKGPYRLAGTVAGDSVTPPTSPASISLPVPVAAGQRVFAYVRVSRVDGRLSSRFRGGAIAA